MSYTTGGAYGHVDTIVISSSLFFFDRTECSLVLSFGWSYFVFIFLRSLIFIFPPADTRLSSNWLGLFLGPRVHRAG